MEQDRLELLERRIAELIEEVRQLRAQQQSHYGDGYYAPTPPTPQWTYGPYNPNVTITWGNTTTPQPPITVWRVNG